MLFIRLAIKKKSKCAFMFSKQLRKVTFVNSLSRLSERLYPERQNNQSSAPDSTAWAFPFVFSSWQKKSMAGQTDTAALDQKATAGTWTHTSPHQQGGLKGRQNRKRCAGLVMNWKGHGKGKRS